MENKKLMTIMEALWNAYRQGGTGDTELLQCAVLSLCAEGKISRDEAVDVRLAVEAELRKSGKEHAFLEVTPELADETVLWLRNCAEEAKEPFATVIQQAAEYLHDFCAEVIHTLPDESTAE